VFSSEVVKPLIEIMSGAYQQWRTLLYVKAKWECELKSSSQRNGIKHVVYSRPPPTPKSGENLIGSVL